MVLIFFNTYIVNFSLRNFTNYHLKIFINRNCSSGWEYVNFFRNIVLNLIYPNTFLSIFYFLIRKIKQNDKNKLMKLLVICASDRSKYFIALNAIKFLDKSQDNNRLRLG